MMRIEVLQVDKGYFHKNMPQAISVFLYSMYLDRWLL